MELCFVSLRKFWLAASILSIPSRDQPLPPLCRATCSALPFATLLSASQLHYFELWKNIFKELIKAKFCVTLYIIRLSMKICGIYGDVCDYIEMQHTCPLPCIWYIKWRGGRCKVNQIPFLKQGPPGKNLKFSSKLGGKCLEFPKSSTVSPPSTLH